MSEHQNILQIDTDAELQKIIRQLDSIPDQLKAPSVLASALNATANEMKRMKIDREIRAYESAGEGTRGRRKMKKGK